MTSGSDGGYRVRASMTFSEQAHPVFVQTLRGLSARGRSRLIHALVERGLTMRETGPQPHRDGPDAERRRAAARVAGLHASPLNALGPDGALLGAEELGE